MRNITFRTQNKFGGTSFRKIDGRKLSNFIKRTAIENGVCEYEILKHYVEKLVTEDINTNITYFEFSWLDEFNHKHLISKYL